MELLYNFRLLADKLEQGAEEISYTDFFGDTHGVMPEGPLKITELFRFREESPIVRVIVEL